jgi:hypothetical protein
MFKGPTQAGARHRRPVCLTRFDGQQLAAGAQPAGFSLFQQDIMPDLRRIIPNPLHAHSIWLVQALTDDLAGLENSGTNRNANAVLKTAIPGFVQEALAIGSRSILDKAGG